MFALPFAKGDAPWSISSLVISASKGPTSVVFWGSVLLSVSFGFHKTFLKCACHFPPEIPAIKFRSFGLCSSLATNLQNSLDLGVFVCQLAFLDCRFKDLLSFVSSLFCSSLFGFLFLLFSPGLLFPVSILSKFCQSRVGFFGAKFRNGRLFDFGRLSNFGEKICYRFDYFVGILEI